jgi:hypothetical protein
MNDKNELSTSALAKELNINPQDLFQQLADMGLIVKKEKNWKKAKSPSKSLIITGMRC